MRPHQPTTIIDRRRFLYALPALALAPRAFAQAGAPPIRVQGLSQMTLTVSDVARSLEFYQGLFGMPVQARQGSTVFLRIGDGPKFLALKPAAAGERPSISAFGMGVEGFSVAGVTRALAGRGVQVTPSGPTVFVTEPSGIMVQLHDVSYCGGSGPLGGECRTVEPSPKKGLLAMRDMSHFTVFVSDQPKTVAFFQEVFGAPIQAYQGAAPAYGIGPGVHFLMFVGGGGRGRAGRGGAPFMSRIDHACMSMRGFDPAAVTKALVGYGLKQMPTQSREPLVTYISLRMPDRGGAPGGTPELYLTDPDGLAIQIQDVTYCGGGGFLGDVCPPV